MENKIIEDFIQRMMIRKLMFNLPPTERDYSDLVVDLNDAGFHPLPYPLCHGEKTIRLRTEVVEYPFMGFFTPFIGVMLHDIYGECPVCHGSGYKPALTKGEEKLLKESVSLDTS